MKQTILLLLASLIASPVFANVDLEIERLIDNIGRSDCTFYRNGKAHTSTEAAEHIERKWDYAKNDVDSLETFIREVASKSWFTGKPYMVKCGETQLTSEQWLLELASSQTPN